MICSEGVKEMDQVRDSDSCEERLTFCISKISLLSQISIWRMGIIIEVYTANKSLQDPVNMSKRLFAESSAECFGHA